MVEDTFRKIHKDSLLSVSPQDPQKGSVYVLGGS